MTLVGYAFLSSMIFAIVAALQLIRAISGWPITINTVNIPVSGELDRLPGHGGPLLPRIFCCPRHRLEVVGLRLLH